MKKENVFKNIRAARKAHVLWVERAKKLVNGLPISEEEIPLDVTACEFGQWFYGDGQVLLAIFSQAAIKKLDDTHKELHDSYMKIFRIYFDMSKQSFFSKLFKSQKKVTDLEKELAVSELNNLIKISDELVSYLTIIDKKMNQIDEAEFARFI